MRASISRHQRDEGPSVGAGRDGRGIEPLVHDHRRPEDGGAQQDEEAADVRGGEARDPRRGLVGAEGDRRSLHGLLHGAARELHEARRASGARRGHDDADLGAHGRAGEGGLAQPLQQGRGACAREERLAFGRRQPTVERQEGDAAPPEVGHDLEPGLTLREVDRHELAGAAGEMVGDAHAAEASARVRVVVQPTTKSALASPRYESSMARATV